MSLPNNKSNEERARWRALCRQKLAEHISSKLNQKVKPEDVRLLTSLEDLYYWSFLPNRQHLFQKQLSKHSLKAYREIYKGVGVTFEAVPRYRSVYSQPGKKENEVVESGRDITTCPQSIGENEAETAYSLSETFTDRIEAMTQEMALLKARYSEAVERVAAKERESEDQTRLIVEIEAQNKELSTAVNKLRAIVQHQSQIIRRCKTRITGSESALFIIRRTLNNYAEKGRQITQNHHLQRQDRQ